MAAGNQLDPAALLAKYGVTVQQPNGLQRDGKVVLDNGGYNTSASPGPQHDPYWGISGLLREYSPDLGNMVGKLGQTVYNGLSKLWNDPGLKALPGPMAMEMGGQEGAAKLGGWLVADKDAEGNVITWAHPNNYDILIDHVPNSKNKPPYAITNYATIPSAKSSYTLADTLDQAKEIGAAIHAHQQYFSKGNVGVVPEGVMSFNDFVTDTYHTPKDIYDNAHGMMLKAAEGEYEKYLAKTGALDLKPSSNPTKDLAPLWETPQDWTATSDYQSTPIGKSMSTQINQGASKPDLYPEQLFQYHINNGLSPEYAFAMVHNKFGPDFWGAEHDIPYTGMQEYKYAKAHMVSPEQFLSARPSQQAVAPIKTGAESIDSIINARDSLYHTTNPSSAVEILKSGRITPGGGDQFRGVATSRVPALSTKTLPVNFVLDNQAMRGLKPTPTADSGFGKTYGNVIMNKNFEFETRTKGIDVPTSTIKGIIINKQMLNAQGYEAVNQHFPELLRIAEEKGIPVKMVETTSELRKYRAKFSSLPPGSPLFSIPPLGAAAGLKYVQNKSTPTPSQSQSNQKLLGGLQ